ncbi:MAG TPA: SUMF1/EgtB/PvdO family nonheme iron enzyme [Labilithrix sp.]|nr:SUMF1/EgtB/PvdO family nonheme iron enzyme [Labilithrix sp.]
MSASQPPPHASHPPPSKPRARRGLRRLLLLLAGVGLPVMGALGMNYWLRAHGLSFAEFANELRPGKGPRFEWRSIDKKHWQALSGTPGEPPEVTDAREGTNAGCPTGMVRVKGSFRRELNGLATGEVERLQDAACTDWISREFPARCRTFDREKIAAAVAKLPAQPMDYCIDRFEYPNVLGQNPMIVATFREAEALCKKSSKRLCTENEWTFACEGEEARPYPYGWTRDTTACVIDRAWRPFTEGALQPRDGSEAREELDRLWQGEPSGSRGACRSPFGVYDLTGNVDEWTRSVNRTGYTSVLKGGYWGPVRARCRPATRAHNEDFVAYQQSFRCCAESTAVVEAPPPAPSVAAANVDAGAEMASVLASDAGASRPTSDLSAEWSPSEEDEIVAIGKARTALCSARGGASTTGGAGLASAAALVSAVFVARRRRRP